MLTRARIERQALIELIAKDVAQNFTRSLIHHRRVMLTSQRPCATMRGCPSIGMNRSQVQSTKCEVESTSKVWK